MITNGEYSFFLPAEEFNSLFRTLPVVKLTLTICIFLMAEEKMFRDFLKSFSDT